MNIINQIYTETARQCGITLAEFRTFRRSQTRALMTPEMRCLADLRRARLPKDEYETRVSRINLAATLMTQEPTVIEDSADNFRIRLKLAALEI